MRGPFTVIPSLNRVDLHPESSIIGAILFIALDLLLDPRNGILVRFLFCQPHI